MKFRVAATLTLLIALSANVAHAQSFGVELFNNLMPASGGMAGASIASPQDVQSAINGNPATLTQFRGTQAAFSGTWIEPTYNLSVAPPGLGFIGVDPFDNAKSAAQGIAAANIGVSQDFSAQGLPMTIGLGLKAGAGAGIDFRHIPESNGTHANLVALDIITGAAIDVTERLSFGAALTLSNATMDGPFVGIVSSSADYALRGTVGVSYDLRPDTALGLFWMTKAGYTFENAVNFDPLLPGPPSRVFFDTEVDRPEVLGLGISNSSLMDGRLLLAFDAVYQQYTEAAMFGALFNDQWALQFGTQYTLNPRVRLRLGYAWNENPMRNVVGDTAGGILPPGGAAHIQYLEALNAAIPQHRLTGGVGIRDVLPGVDFDVMGGGMFEASQTFGISTATVQSYWVGAGITWRCGRGACAGECK
jgi:long-chain fatty acid transport protein